MSNTLAEAGLRHQQQQQQRQQQQQSPVPPTRLEH
eukprot:CAMPEP_0177324472 /NCGR_PEP_ID=MMETSP0368-20130122/17297_1 /TAXON_ID=447022 ORGANISM="Scrippsiella hangoei-like, Strain SHHI-4" /NCGR_SAMPLE_ID=MMETSP0368 /ASSEMBLY_ACC=CAM_ASM_000363 /LENGTH=34 /DNA_ID= /DNA_START= /DNA_END= /DNA_ORIENTATION=